MTMMSLNEGVSFFSSFYFASFSLGTKQTPCKNKNHTKHGERGLLIVPFLLLCELAVLTVRAFGLMMIIAL